MANTTKLGTPSSTMNKTLYKLPVAPTAHFRGPEFKVLYQRKCEIAFSIEAEGGSEKWLALQFDGVEAFKVTYLTSLGSIDRELRSQAYGFVVSVEDSPWLAAVRASYANYSAARHRTPSELKHLAICFDDGPFYELICNTFKEVTVDKSAYSHYGNRDD
jgi:hypothetical protein